MLHTELPWCIQYYRAAYRINVLHTELPWCTQYYRAAYRITVLHTELPCCIQNYRGAYRIIMYFNLYASNSLLLLTIFISLKKMVVSYKLEEYTLTAIIPSSFNIRLQVESVIRPAVLFTGPTK
jgi:hypothetical protein